jgi:hypothetical protein
VLCWGGESKTNDGAAAPSGILRGIPYSDLIVREAEASGIPIDLVVAVIQIESGFNPSVVGAVGEIGLMQVRPETAAMLGFKGGLDMLAEPEINIRLGVRYLARAWQLAGGDLCRTLIKYRAGHGEERTSIRSAHYCQRAREYLGGHGSGLAVNKPAASTPAKALVRVSAPIARRGTPEASRRFWAMHQARVSKLRSAVRAKWAKLAQLSARK